MVKITTSRNMWKHWCPNGCGKSVIFHGRSWGHVKAYKCERCDKEFTKEDLQKI